MSYKFVRDGIEEDVEPERWRWTATYGDGTSLKQFDDQGYFHQLSEIDQSHLMTFMMSCDGLPPIVLFIYPDYKVIHFYRNARLHVGNGQMVDVRLYCFGYETPTGKLVMAIMPDDTVIVVRDDDDIVIGAI